MPSTADSTPRADCNTSCLINGRMKALHVPNPQRATCKPAGAPPRMHLRGRRHLWSAQLECLAICSRPTRVPLTTVSPNIRRGPYQVAGGHSSSCSCSRRHARASDEGGQLKIFRMHPCSSSSVRASDVRGNELIKIEQGAWRGADVASTVEMGACSCSGAGRGRGTREPRGMHERRGECDNSLRIIAWCVIGVFQRRAVLALPSLRRRSHS